MEKGVVKSSSKTKKQKSEKTWKATVGPQDNTNYFPRSKLTPAEISSSEVRWYSWLYTPL